VHEPRARKKRFEDDNFKGNSESADDTISDDGIILLIFYISLEIEIYLILFYLS